jgi:hypothetical protein
MSRNAVIVVAFVVGLVALIVYSVLQVQKITCDVCITYKGEQACRTGVGANEKEAVRAATESACVVLARGGMDERINCGQTPPSSKTCK